MGIYNYPSDGSLDINVKGGLRTLGVLVAIAIAIFYCGAATGNAIDVNRAATLFAKAAGGNPTITDMQCTNPAFVSGDPYNVDCTFKIDGDNAGGYCRSWEFSSPVCVITYRADSDTQETNDHTQDCQNEVVTEVDSDSIEKHLGHENDTFLDGSPLTELPPGTSTTICHDRP